MRRFFFVPFLLVLLIFLPSCLPKGQTQKSSSLKKISSYKIFYGAPDEKILNEMKKYNMVIVEPYQFTKEQVDKVKRSGTILMGYISVMELDSEKTGLVSKAEPSDYFIKNGKHVYFSQWHSNLMDISSEHYRKVLFDEIKNNVATKGFDGIFLDTIGDIDDQLGDDSVTVEKQRNALVSFLKELKSQYPNYFLIQNWGFDTLQKSTAHYVNGIMWEDFHYDKLSKDAWSINWINDLKKLQQQNDIAVFTVSLKSNRENSEFSKNNGFIHFHTDKGYDEW